MVTDFPFLEFFAGGGLARIGLGDAWTCVFANDISAKKAATYRTNFAPAHELFVGDIHAVSQEHIPGEPVLAWASFPCQDLSLAGNGRGLSAARSGTFWPFWSLMLLLDHQGRGIPIIVLENVPGLLVANNGKDFEELLTVLTTAGYRCGTLVIDAATFVPQSRSRVFIVAIKRSVDIPDGLVLHHHTPRISEWQPATLTNAYVRLPRFIQDSWLWWRLPVPPVRQTQLADLIEHDVSLHRWNSAAETQRILRMMSSAHRQRVIDAQRDGRQQIGTIYKRIRIEDGERLQRAEVRFDGISGCLRTPTGGSSRQTIIVVADGDVQTRLLSVREAARLMGVPETYTLPENYNDGYHIMGDAVAVPVVSWLEQHLLRRLAHNVTRTVPLLRAA